jgi:NADPH-dependent 2,4-dienoyl-CoA reductase/sulfur reductase-like enzyme/rhodanese-related sulfurtransferase
MSQTSSSPKLRIVIIGGVAGGASAAARARRVNAQAEIIVLEKGPYISFANCGLPYHIGGDIAKRESLLVATPELFHQRFRIDIRTMQEATAIDRNGKNVTVKNHNTGETYSLPYDKLIIATGSEPLRPPFYPTQAPNAFQLWTLTELDRVMSYLKAHSVKRVSVVGAGFVGLETVEQLQRRGIAVDLLERAPQVLGQLDREMALPIQNELTRHGVKVYVNAELTKFEFDGERIVALELADGSKIETDMVLIGAGIRPRVELAQAAGIELGKRGVKVNEFMQTNDPDVYAVGDIVEYTHRVTGLPQLLPLAGPANRSGRVAGTHAASGKSEPMGTVLGTSIVRVFDLTAACTGFSERVCKLNNIPCRSVIIQAAHHASYFPGAKNLTLKLIYAPDSGKILGASAIGAEGVDKRMDIIATAMQFDGTVYDLADLDLAYAPPYGSAKDPVHMAAFAACNDLQEWPQIVEPDFDLEGLQVVDVRTAKERDALPLPNAIGIPVDEIAARWQELDNTRPTVVVCHSGKRAHVAACWLKGLGFQDVKNLSGGMSIRKLLIT